jgi:glycosyltransferase involved in cell wall biosynthesis
VIVPCHDLGPYLDEAVGSVLGQTFPDFEILIVDDGSTDPATVALLADYRRPKTRVLRSDNRGLPAAKNLGLAHTKGELVCFLDADDRLAPACLERGVRALQADPGLDFASHWVRWFGDEEADWAPTRCDLPALLEKNTVNGAALVRRTALLAAGGFDEAMREGCEDWDLWLTLVERGHRGVILPEILYHYRRRAGSMSRVMQGEIHDGLHAYLVAKHRASFARHAAELLLGREARAVDLLRIIHDLEVEHATRLGPELVRRREALDLLARHARRRDPGRLQALQAEVDRARHEVAALRASLSWRLTGPLRAVYDWLGRPGQGR